MKHLLLFEDFRPGYKKTSLEKWQPIPAEITDWKEKFNYRAEELRKRRRSMYVKPVIDTVEAVVFGMEDSVPYEDLRTSTAGFQWGKEFADVIANDGLAKMVKKGNQVTLEPNVDSPDFQKYASENKGRLMGKKFGF